MKRLLIAGLFLAMAGIASPSFAKEDSLADLRAWMGKYPTDKVGGKNFWDNLSLRTKSKELLGEERFALMLKKVGKAGSTPVVEIDQETLHFSLCSAEACPTEFLSAFIRPEEGRLFFCWHGIGAVEAMDTWYETGEGPKQIEFADCLMDKRELFKQARIK